MLRYEFIKKEWIVSPTARRVYRVSASLSVVLFLAWWALAIMGGVPENIAPLVRILLLAGVLGAGITIVGMEFFLFRFDNSHPLKQAVWFCVMLFPLLGAALYCFIIYSRSDVFKSTQAKRAKSAST
jgi:glycerol-3-phosphate acyltransferase PlsY